MATVNDRLLLVLADYKPLEKPRKHFNGRPWTPEEAAVARAKAKANGTFGRKWGKTRLEGTLQILERARTLIEEGWTQEALARTPSGMECSVDDPLACEWCLSGAITRAAHELGRKSSGITAKRIIDAAKAITQANQGRTPRSQLRLHPVLAIATLNDQYITDSSEALEMLDQAISWVEAKQGEIPVR